MSRRTLLIRLSIFIFALATFNTYVALGIVTRWPWAQNHLVLIGCVTAGCLVLELGGFLGDRFIYPALRTKIGGRFDLTPIFKGVSWISYLALGALSCLFLYTVVADVSELIWRHMANPASPGTGNEYFLLAVIGATLLTLLAGIRQAALGPVVRAIDIPLKNLPVGFDGFTIAQISDLHIGPILKRDYTEKVVAAVNELKPDMIVLTGDFVDGTVADLRHDVEPLAELKAPYGRFFVTGNHEYYWGPDEWIAEFKKLGLHVLLNEHHIVRRDEDAIIMAGVTDISMSDSSPKKALEGAPPDLIKILLAHQPASYAAAHEAGFDLQLSGHTHGGQYFPFNIVVKFFQRYVRGLNRHGDMWIYVSAGTGYWGPPLRTGIPSEITRITLRAA